MSIVTNKKQQKPLCKFRGSYAVELQISFDSRVGWFMVPAYEFIIHTLTELCLYSKKRL